MNRMMLKEPSDRIKELARINNWSNALLSRGLAVIGPYKSDDEAFLTLCDVAKTLNGNEAHEGDDATKIKAVNLFGFRSVADFFAFYKRPDSGYFHGKYPLASDAHAEPPIPCEFKVGDIVTYTNDYGVEFSNKVVTGFASEVEYGRFVYIDNDSWWFPHSPESLTLETNEVRQIERESAMAVAHGITEEETRESVETEMPGE